MAAWLEQDNEDTLCESLALPPPRPPEQPAAWPTPYHLLDDEAKAVVDMWFAIGLPVEMTYVHPQSAWLGYQPHWLAPISRHHPRAYYAYRLKP